MFSRFVTFLILAVAGSPLVAQNETVADEVLGTPRPGAVNVPRPSAGAFGASSADLRYDNATTTARQTTTTLRAPDPLSSAALRLASDLTTSTR